MTSLAFKASRAKSAKRKKATAPTGDAVGAVETEVQRGSADSAA